MNTTIIPSASSDDMQFNYAAFWMRFWALTIDNALLIFVMVIFSLLFGIFSGVMHLVAWPFSFFSFEWDGGYGYTGVFKMTVICWLYFALMESSGWQATLGKRMLGICVVTEAGERISFKRATIRFFAKGLSAFIFFLGFIMALFTARSQALHDMIAETLVIRR